MATTIARQPKGIPSGGQFSTTEHAESVLILHQNGPTWLKGDDVLDAAAIHSGSGVVPGIRRRIAETTTESGRQLFLQRCDALYGTDSSFTIDKSVHGPTPEQCDALADLGYISVNDFAPEKLKNLRGIQSIIDGRISSERLKVLGLLSRHEFQWSAWEREAYLNADLPALGAVIAEANQSPKDQYVRTVALLGKDKAERAKQGLAAGLVDRGLIEAETHPVETIARLRFALPSSKRGAWHIVGLAEKGITAAHLRNYGTNACEQYTAEQLEASELPPKTIRSFLASGVRADLEAMSRVNQAGFMNGADLKAASQSMGTNDPDKLAAVRKHADGRSLAKFRAALGSHITHADAVAISVLRDHGVTDPDQLRPYTAAAHPRANRLTNRNQSILAIHAAVIKAKISPERLGQIQRAGIPIDQAPAFKDNMDLWAAGREFRAAWDAEQAVRVAKGWERTPSPWAFREDNYLDGESD